MYLYLTLSFVAILIFVILSTSIYFRYIHNKFNKNGVTIKNIIEENIADRETVERVQLGSKNALIYGSIVGATLVLVIASHIVKPIRKLTEATKKVASGNFDVKVYSDRNDEVGDLVDNFNLMVKELNSIEYLRKDFVRNISHELKTPIASIQGFTKLLADENLSKEEKKEYIDIILEETKRLSNLSSNMIKLSKVENQEIIINKKKFRLDEQIRKVIIMLEEQINEKKLKVELETKEISIIQDEDLIMEIWINLLNNAVKYTNNNGKIEIKIDETDTYVEVKIKDNGIGIEEEKQCRIFERFYQAEVSHSADGSGLGLAIVKRIVELIKGKIRFESKQGEGTTFFIQIPKNI